ncbi:MAG: hypothetical protein KC656_34655, partial [Myxococcales bacterium]|nr:hypothetical protein [Myxococcales bacterium]
MRVCLPLLLWTTAPAWGAEVTELPPNLRADLHAGYVGSFEQVGLRETDQTVGLREDLRHGVALRVDFTVYTGVALTLGVPVLAQQQVDFPRSRQMLYEPATDGGSYENGPALDPEPSWSAGGAQGVWLGAAFSPFREEWSKGL